MKRNAVSYYRTSSATNVGADKDSEKRQRAAVQAYATAPARGEGPHATRARERRPAHQLAVYKRSIKRPNINDGDRTFWLTLMRMLKEWRQGLVTPRGPRPVHLLGRESSPAISAELTHVACADGDGFLPASGPPSDARGLREPTSGRCHRLPGRGEPDPEGTDDGEAAPPTRAPRPYGGTLRVCCRRGRRMGHYGSIREREVSLRGKGPSSQSNRLPRAW